MLQALAVFTFLVPSAGGAAGAGGCARGLHPGQPPGSPCACCAPVPGCDYTAVAIGVSLPVGSSDGALPHTIVSPARQACHLLFSPTASQDVSGEEYWCVHAARVELKRGRIRGRIGRKTPELHLVGMGALHASLGRVHACMHPEGSRALCSAAQAGARRWRWRGAARPRAACCGWTRAPSWPRTCASCSTARPRPSTLSRSTSRRSSAGGALWQPTHHVVI